MFFVQVFLFLFLLLGAGIVLYFLQSFVRLWKKEPPFVPLPHSTARKLPSVLTLPPQSVFYDLGSGDGRIVTIMANAYKNSTCIGVERDYVAHLISRIRLLCDPLPNATFVRDDFYNIPLENATHVYLYLFPKTIDALFPLFTAKLRKGAIIFSCNFKCSVRQPDEVIPIGKSKFGHTLYKYYL